jgi:hypothetical protein
VVRNPVHHALFGELFFSAFAPCPPPIVRTPVRRNDQGRWGTTSLPATVVNVCRASQPRWCREGRCPQRPTSLPRGARTRNDRAYLLCLRAVSAPIVRTPVRRNIRDVGDNVPPGNGHATRRNAVGVVVLRASHTGLVPRPSSVAAVAPRVKPTSKLLRRWTTLIGLWDANPLSLADFQSPCPNGCQNCCCLIVQSRLQPRRRERAQRIGRFLALFTMGHYGPRHSETGSKVFASCGKTAKGGSMHRRQRGQRSEVSNREDFSPCASVRRIHDL